MASDEHQREHVVVDPVGIDEEASLLCGVRRAGQAPRCGAALGEVAAEGGIALVERGAPPEDVDGAAPSHRGEPPRRVARHTVAGPRDEHLRQGLLSDVFGEREVTGVAGERTDDSSRLDPPHRADGLPGVAYSCPVASRHARSFWIHSLSWGNSSMLACPRRPRMRA
jgi:hypothetical protein